VAWNPPEGVDLDEVIEVAEEMGYLPDKSGQEYIDHLREDTDVTVDTGLQDPFEFEAFSGAPGRRRRTGQRFDSIIPQRDEEDFGLELPFDEDSDLEDTGILSADEVRRLF